MNKQVTQPKDSLEQITSQSLFVFGQPIEAEKSEANQPASQFDFTFSESDLEPETTVHKKTSVNRKLEI